MAGFEAPSFSLGFDFELVSEPKPTPVPVPSPKRAKRFLPTQNLRTIVEDDDDDDFESPVLPASGPDPKCTDPPLVLKRLRRGTTSCKPTPAVEGLNLKEESMCDVEDDIEDFSSQEDREEDHSKAPRSVSSCSKIPLHRHQDVSMQSATRCTVKGKKEDSDSPAFENMEMSDNKCVFSKLAVSPLRRFQLIDSDSCSDSDDPSTSEHLKKKVKVESRGVCAASSKQSDDTSHVASQSEDLWKGFLTDENFHIPTPALDEICEEYFRSLRDKNDIQNANEDYHPKSILTENSSMQQKNNSSLCPAHSYFFHKELRIQQLVRDRLPHFFPLGAKNSQGIKQNDVSIDYMGQFSLRGGPENRTNTVAAVASSTKSRKKNNRKEASEAPMGWVNTKDSAGAPKDAGKRRVHADSKSAGRWLTAADGKRIYVTRGGQELSGRGAYIHYRKESGPGLKKSKKKAIANKKSAAKNTQR